MATPLPLEPSPQPAPEGEPPLDVLAHDARLQADLVADYLQDRGFTPERDEEAVPAAPEVQGDARRFLFELGAALRLRSFRKSRLIEYLPDDIPSDETALSLASDAAVNRTPIGQTPLAVMVRRIVRDHLTTRSHIDLGVDVVLHNQPESFESLLDQVAAFLWKHRGLAAEVNN